MRIGLRFTSAFIRVSLDLCPVVIEVSASIEIDHAILPGIELSKSPLILLETSFVSTFMVREWLVV